MQTIAVKILRLCLVTTLSPEEDVLTEENHLLRVVFFLIFIRKSASD
jgi:hypothetical protein